EVAPTANPPVCKIVDFGKFRYDISKHSKDKKPASAKLKEIKFRVNIDEHDYVTKVRHAEEFLDRGNKVRVQLQFRGREMAHQELATKLGEKGRDDFPSMPKGKTDQKPAGHNTRMTLAPLPANRRKRKFTAPEPVEESEQVRSPANA